MLMIALAGLVLNGILTIEQAECVDRRMGTRKVPKTVKECVEQIQHEIDIVKAEIIE